VDPQLVESVEHAVIAEPVRRPAQHPGQLDGQVFEGSRPG